MVPITRMRGEISLYVIDVRENDAVGQRDGRHIGQE